MNIFDILASNVLESVLTKTRTVVRCDEYGPWKYRRETLTFFYRDQYTAIERADGNLKAVWIFHCLDSIWDILVGLIPEVDWWFLEQDLISWFSSIDEFHEHYGIPHYSSIRKTVASQFEDLLSGYEDLLLDTEVLDAGNFLEYLKSLYGSPAA
jgi:hypothetical protein